VTPVKTYKHINTREAFMKCHEVIQEYYSYTKYYVEWINAESGMSHGMDVIDIRHCDAEKWEEM